MNVITFSSLGHTWILDLDGTIVKHNGYKLDGEDTFLNGAEEFLNSIPESDLVIIITSRTLEYKEITEKFLDEHNICYDYIIYNAPHGERILINDRKPSGINMAYAVNTQRDSFVALRMEVDENL